MLNEKGEKEEVGIFLDGQGGVSTDDFFAVQRGLFVMKKGGGIENPENSLEVSCQKNVSFYEVGGEGNCLSQESRQV